MRDASNQHQIEHSAPLSPILSSARLGWVLSVLLRRMVKSHFTLLSLALVLTGCSINFSHNYRGESRFWGGYEAGKIYILKRDVFVMKIDANDGLAGSRLALVPEREFQLGRHYSAPTSVEAYRRDPVGAHTYRDPVMEYAFQLTNTSICVLDKVYGIAAAGVRLRPTRIERNCGLNTWFGCHDVLTPFAKILDGPIEGHEVDITDVSDYYQINESGPFVYRPITPLLDVEK